MRVIHVAPTGFGPSGLFGGGERYPLELARALARTTACELVTFGQRESVERVGGLTIRVLRPVANLGGHPARPVAPSLPRALRGADIVHVHHMRSPASILAALSARARRVPVVVTDHGLAGSDWGGLLPRLYDRFLLVSRHSAERLGAPSDRTRIIGGGADLERYRPDPRQRRAGVLYVGRVTPHKGIDFLIRALPAGAELTIAGSEGHDSRPPERDYPALLRTLATGRAVRFLGPVPDEALPDLMRGASVVVLPSVQRTVYGRDVPTSELLGLVLLEAMASGTPVIASRIGGTPEVVEDAVSGYLVPPGDVQALRERLEAVLSNPARAAEMGERARRRAETAFSWTGVADRCLETYAELVGG